jgi:hypothetical protein
VKGPEWRAEVRRALAGDAARKRRQQHRPRKALNVRAGMVRLPPRGTDHPATGGAAQEGTT